MRETLLRTPNSLGNFWESSDISLSCCAREMFEFVLADWKDWEVLVFRGAVAGVVHGSAPSFFPLEHSPQNSSKGFKSCRISLALRQYHSN
jgi:hypothetical protein